MADLLELRDLIRGEVAEALLEQVRLLVRVVSGVSPGVGHQLPEGGVVHARGVGRGLWGLGPVRPVRPVGPEPGRCLRLG